jgi:hypothetical protein
MLEQFAGHIADYWRIVGFDALSSLDLALSELRWRMERWKLYRISTDFAVHSRLFFRASDLLFKDEGPQHLIVQNEFGMFGLFSIIGVATYNLLADDSEVFDYLTLYASV